MPSPLWLLISMLVVVGSQDYHYQPPQTPFTAETYHQPQAPQQPQTTKFVVQTLGRTYGLETQRAPAIYEDHQTQVIRVLEQRQLQQQPQTYYQAPQQQQQYSYPAPVPQQLHTSSYTNPLLVSSSYQAPPQALAPPAPAPPPQPLSYYQPQQQQQPLVPAHQRSPAPIVGYATASQQALQPGNQYLPPQQPPPQKLFFGNPQPYASVTIGGQQVLDAGHGSGVAPNEVQVQLVAATGQQPQQPRIGDHVGQSQGAQVDGFDYKQTSPGDTRDYQRFVTNCGPGGQCQRKELGPGEVDPTHQRVLQFTRSSTQPRIEGCFKSPVIYVPVGAEVNNQGQLRPKNRRQNERQEQILSRYPYN